MTWSTSLDDKKVSFYHTYSTAIKQTLGKRYKKKYAFFKSVRYESIKKEVQLLLHSYIKKRDFIPSIDIYLTDHKILSNRVSLSTRLCYLEAAIRSYPDAYYKVTPYERFVMPTHNHVSFSYPLILVNILLLLFLLYDQPFLFVVVTMSMILIIVYF